MQGAKQAATTFVVAHQSPPITTINFEATVEGITNGASGGLRSQKVVQKAREKAEYDEAFCGTSAGSKVVQKVQEVKLERPESKIEQKKKKVVQFELSSQSFSRSQPTDTEQSQSYTESNSDLNKFKKTSSREADQSADNDGSIEEIDDQFQSFRISPSRQQSSSEVTITNDKSQSQLQVLHQDLTPQKIESALGNIGSLRTSDGVESRQIQSTAAFECVNQFDQDEVAPQTGPTTSQIDLERVDSQNKNILVNQNNQVPQSNNIQAAMASIMKQENDERVEREKQQKRFEFSDAEEKFLEQKILEILERNKKKQLQQMHPSQPFNQKQSQKPNEYSAQYASATSTTTKALEPTESELQTVQIDNSYEPPPVFNNQPADQQIGQIIGGQKQRSRMKDNIYRVGNKKQNTVEDKNNNNIVVIESSQQSAGPSHHQYMQGCKKPPIHCMTMTQTLLNKPQKSKQIGDVSSYITGSKSSQHSRKETSCNIDGSSIQPSMSPPQIAFENKGTNVMKLKIKKLKSANNQSISSEFHNFNLINKIKRGLEEVSASQNQSCDPYTEASKKSLSKPSRHDTNESNFSKYDDNQILTKEFTGDNSQRDLLLQGQILTSKTVQAYSQEDIKKQAQNSHNQSKDVLTEAMYKSTEREGQLNTNFITRDAKRVFDKKKQRFEKIRKMRGLSEEGCQTKSIEQSMQFINENYKLKGPSSTSLGAGVGSKQGHEPDKVNIRASMNQCDLEKLIQLSDAKHEGSSADSLLETPKQTTIADQKKQQNKTKFMKISENQSEEASHDYINFKSGHSEQNMGSNNNTAYSNYYNKHDYTTKSATATGGQQHELQNHNYDSRSHTAGRPNEQCLDIKNNNKSGIVARFGNQFMTEGVRKEIDDCKSDNSIYGNPNITSTSSLTGARNQVKSPKILVNQPKRKAKVVNQNGGVQYQKSPNKIVQPLNSTKHEDFKNKLLENQINFLHNSQQRQAKETMDDNNSVCTNNNFQQNFNSNGQVNNTFGANDSKYSYYLAPTKSNPRASINHQNIKNLDENFRLASKSIGGGSLGKESTSTFSIHDQTSKSNHGNLKSQIVKTMSKNNQYQLAVSQQFKTKGSNSSSHQAQRSSIESIQNLSLQQHIQLKLMKKPIDTSDKYEVNQNEGIAKNHPTIQINHKEDEKSSKDSLKSGKTINQNHKLPDPSLKTTTPQKFLKATPKHNNGLSQVKYDANGLNQRVADSNICMSQQYNGINGFQITDDNLKVDGEQNQKLVQVYGEVGKRKVKKEKIQSVDSTNMQRNLHGKDLSTNKHTYQTQFVNNNHQYFAASNKQQQLLQKDRDISNQLLKKDKQFNENYQNAYKTGKIASKTSIATKAPTPAPQMNAISSIAESISSQDKHGYHHPHTNSLIPKGSINNFNQKQNQFKDTQQQSSMILSQGNDQFDIQDRQQSPFDYQGNMIRQQLYHNPDNLYGQDNQSKDQQPSLQSSPLACSRTEKQYHQNVNQNKKKPLKLQYVNLQEISSDHQAYIKAMKDISGFGTSTNCKKTLQKVTKLTYYPEKVNQEQKYLNNKGSNQLSNKQISHEYKQLPQANLIISQSDNNRKEQNKIQDQTEFQKKSPLITPSGAQVLQSLHDGDFSKTSKPASLSKKSNIKTIGKQYMVTTNNLKKSQQGRFKQGPQTVAHRLQSDQDVFKYLSKNGNQNYGLLGNKSHSNAGSIDKSQASEQGERPVNTKIINGLIAPGSVIQNQKYKQKQLQVEMVNNKQKSLKQKNFGANYIKDAINLNKRKASILVDSQIGKNIKLLQPNFGVAEANHKGHQNQTKSKQLEKKESRGSIQSMNNFNMNAAGLIYYKNADTSVMNQAHQNMSKEPAKVDTVNQDHGQSSQSPTSLNQADKDSHGRINHNKFQSASINYIVNNQTNAITSDKMNQAQKNQVQKYQQSPSYVKPTGHGHINKGSGPTKTQMQVYNSADFNEPPQVVQTDTCAPQQQFPVKGCDIVSQDFPDSYISQSAQHNPMMSLNGEVLNSQVIEANCIPFSPQPSSQQVVMYPYQKGNYSTQNSHNSKSSSIDNNYNSNHSAIATKYGISNITQQFGVNNPGNGYTSQGNLNTKPYTNHIQSHASQKQLKLNDPSILQKHQKRAIIKKNVHERQQFMVQGSIGLSGDAGNTQAADKDLFYNMLEISKQTESLRQNQKKMSMPAKQIVVGQQNAHKLAVKSQIQTASIEQSSATGGQCSQNNLQLNINKSINSKESLKSSSVETNWKGMPVTLGSYYQSSQPQNKKKVKFLKKPQAEKAQSYIQAAAKQDSSLYATTAKSQQSFN